MIIKQACLKDVDKIYALTQPFITQDMLLPRTHSLFTSDIEDFHLLLLDHTLISCAALRVLDDQSSEIYCVATLEKYQNKGYATRIIQHIEHAAKLSGTTKYIYIMTKYQSKWCQRMQYKQVNINSLPKHRLETYNMNRKSFIFKKVLTYDSI